MRLITEHPTTDLMMAADSTPAGGTISGLLVPYGETGYTSAGPLTVHAGTVRLPSDLKRVKLLSAHSTDDATPIGYLESVAESPEGLRGVFRLGSTPEATRAALEAREGLRDAFSVELHAADIRSDGVLGSADMSAVALIPIPAFASARVADVAAQHTEPDPSTGDDPMTTNAPDTESSATDRGPAVHSVEPLAVQAAAAPQSLIVGDASAKPADLTMTDVYAALVAKHTGRYAPEVEAVLSDVTYTANSAVTPQAYAGELWSGVDYRRQIVPLVSYRPLTSYKVVGWRWTTRPEVAPWAGDKAAVPSNTPVTEAAETSAERLAGAHDLDRKFRDFNDTEFFASYYQAMTNSYARQSDAAATAALVAGATASGTAPDVLAAIVAGALAMPDGVSPSWILLGKDLLPEAFAITKDAFPALLSMSLGLDGNGSADSIRIVSHSTVPANTVLIGARPAATFYELPSSPIRVEAVDLANGGVDAGVFGYFASIINDASALRSVTVSAA